MAGVTRNHSQLTTQNGSPTRNCGFGEGSFSADEADRTQEVLQRSLARHELATRSGPGGCMFDNCIAL